MNGRQATDEEYEQGREHSEKGKISMARTTAIDRWMDGWTDGWIRGWMEK